MANASRNTLNRLIKDSSRERIKDPDIDADGIEEQKRKLENQRYKDDSEYRIRLAIWTRWTVSAWLGTVLLILCLNGYLFFLSDAVLIALVCTTTLNVLGLAYIVLKGYFHATDKWK